MITKIMLLIVFLVTIGSLTWYMKDKQGGYKETAKMNTQIEVKDIETTIDRPTPDAVKKEKSISDKERTTGALSLTPRSGNNPEVSNGIPHIQKDQVSPDDVYESYMTQILAIQGLIDTANASSFSGARAFELDTHIEINPAAIIKGREFGHIHANPGRGSLHIVLSEQDAKEVVLKGWGVYHPFATNGSIPGMVMVFSPRDEKEIAVMMSIVKTAYDFAKLD